MMKSLLPGFSLSLFLSLALGGCDDPEIGMTDTAEQAGAFDAPDRQEPGVAERSEEAETDRDDVPILNAEALPELLRVVESWPTLEGLDPEEYATLYGDPFEEELTLQMSEEDDEEWRSCPLEVVEPCEAPVAVCAVRCCDNTLHKSYQICGNCGTWAKGACANHGTRRRIRWEPPYYY